MSAIINWGPNENYQVRKTFETSVLKKTKLFCVTNVPLLEVADECAWSGNFLGHWRTTSTPFWQNNDSVDSVVFGL